MSNTLLESLWARVDTNIGSRIKQISELLTQALSANTESTSARDIAVAAEKKASTAATNAASSESVAKSAETAASGYAATAQTSATEAVDAKNRAVEIVGGDFATLDYVDQRVPITGTGFPEGKVTAPVGAIYTDSAATNGAIRWIKTSGTGATGWEVEYGDTGSRLIYNSETLPGATTGSVRVRRVGNLVSLNILMLVLDPGYGSSEAAFTLPRGFVPENQVFSRPIIDRNFISNHHTIDINSRGEAIILGKPTGRLYFEMSWFTKEGWPTPLPGIPSQGV